MPPFKLSKAANGVPFLSRLRMNDTAWDMVALLGFGWWRRPNSCHVDRRGSALAYEGKVGVGRTDQTVGF